MMRTSAWLFVGLLGCTKAGSSQESEAQPEPIVVTAQARMPAPTPAPAPPPAPTQPPAPTPPPPPPAKATAKVTVQMTAATLADECGGSAPGEEPKAKAKSARAKADRACDQTSMQLSVKASAAGGPTQITVKKVELFDDKGVKIGTLSARSPTIWSKGTYKTWNQKIAPGQELSVSYVLSQPAWGPIADRRMRTYVLAAVVTVGGGDQVVKRDIHIAAPTSLSHPVKT